MTTEEGYIFNLKNGFRRCTEYSENPKSYQNAGSVSDNTLNLCLVVQSQLRRRKKTVVTY